VLGSGAPSLPGLRALAADDPRLTLHVDTQDMPRLTLEADLAIGAGGSTTWERCVLALPTLLLILAANQREASAALARPTRRPGPGRRRSGLRGGLRADAFPACSASPTAARPAVGRLGRGLRRTRRGAGRAHLPGRDRALSERAG
jgi:hypothetical protein